jgi:16S rRNA (guanine527-N7)-methyltransferase
LGFEGERFIAFALAARAPESYHCPSVAAKLGLLVARATSGFGPSIDAGAASAIEKWLERLEEWNARMDLTAARSAPELVDLMLADALVLSTRVTRGARVVDVGTGAGAPGLALALLRPDIATTLIEPLGKRASFLRTVIGVVERTDIVLERKRGDAFAGRREWDVAISRATLEPSAWLDLGVSLVHPGGIVWTLLARDEPPTHPHAVVEDDFAYAWPLTGAERRAVLYRVA